MSVSQKTEREELKEELFAKGAALHDKARRGDRQATREAYELLKVVHQLDPSDPVALAYYGSALALMGRDAVDPNAKVQNALKGLKLLDQAAKAAPDSIAVRTLRAHVNFNMPEHFFSRTAVAVEDFTYLVQRYEAEPGALSRTSYWEALYHLGKAYQTLDEVELAKAVWEKLISVKPSRKYLRLLRSEGMDVGVIDEDGEAAEERARVLREGIALHERGLNDDKAAAEGARRLFEEAVEQYPDDALLKAYLGSSVSLAGRYADDANVAFASAIKGMKIVDEAVKTAPEEAAVRLVRARHALRLPELFFRRTGVAIVDLEFLRDRHTEGAAVLSKPDWLEVLWLLGSAYFRLGLVEEARSTWARLSEEDPDGAYRASIEAMLAPVDARIEWHELDPEDKTALLQEGIRLHDLGVQGNKAAALRAYELIKQAFELDPDDPLTRAYYGSAIALSVKDSADTSETFRRVIQAVIHLNTAVKLAPESETVRLLRGCLCFKLPETMFHFTKTAIEDFEFLRTLYRAKIGEPAGERGGAARQALARILKDLASAYRRVGRDAEAQAAVDELNGLEGSHHGIG